MSASDPNQPRTFMAITRNQRADYNRTTPALVDEKWPTVDYRISNFGKNTSTVGVGSAWLMGSRRFVGSPDDITVQLLHAHFATNTPNIWFALTHSRGTPRAFAAQFPGTVQMWYLASKGEMESIGAMDRPLASLPPGTVRLYALGPGSTKYAANSALNFQGVGSTARVNIFAQLDFYPV